MSGTSLKFDLVELDDGTKTYGSNARSQLLTQSSKIRGSVPALQAAIMKRVVGSMADRMAEVAPVLDSDGVKTISWDEFSRGNSWPDRLTDIEGEITRALEENYKDISQRMHDGWTATNIVRKIHDAVMDTYEDFSRHIDDEADAKSHDVLKKWGFSRKRFDTDYELALDGDEAHQTCYDIVSQYAGLSWCEMFTSAMDKIYGERAKRMDLRFRSDTYDDKVDREQLSVTRDFAKKQLGYYTDRKAEAQNRVEKLSALIGLKPGTIESHPFPSLFLVASAPSFEDWKSAELNGVSKSESAIIQTIQRWRGVLDPSQQSSAKKKKRKNKKKKKKAAATDSEGDTATTSQAIGMTETTVTETTISEAGTEDPDQDAGEEGAAADTESNTSKPKKKGPVPKPKRRKPYGVYKLLGDVPPSSATSVSSQGSVPRSATWTPDATWEDIRTEAQEMYGKKSKSKTWDAAQSTGLPDVPEAAETVGEDDPSADLQLQNQLSSPAMSRASTWKKGDVIALDLATFDPGPYNLFSRFTEEGQQSVPDRQLLENLGGWSSVQQLHKLTLDVSD